MEKEREDFAIRQNRMIQRLIQVISEEDGKEFSGYVSAHHAIVCLSQAIDHIKEYAMWANVIDYPEEK